MQRPFFIPIAKKRRNERPPVRSTGVEKAKAGTKSYHKWKVNML